MRPSPKSHPAALIDGKVSILMPAFNESADIAANLREAVRTFFELHADFEVILIDDGSPDSTYLHALRVLTEHPEHVRIVRYDSNQGKGNALMTGAACARGDYVVFLDADMDLHPEQLPVFFGIMSASGADAVIGSKHHAASSVQYPTLRRFLSMAYFHYVWLLFGLPLRDTQTGLKLFRRAVLDDVFPRVLAKRFAFDIELLAVAHHLGYKLTDAPVTLDFRRSLSRIRARDVWNMFIDTLAIFYRLRIRRYYDAAPCAAAEPAPPAHREISPDEVASLLKH